MFQFLKNLFLPHSIVIKVAISSDNPYSVIQINEKNFHSISFRAFKIPSSSDYFIVDEQLKDIVK